MAVKLGISEPKWNQLFNFYTVTICTNCAPKIYDALKNSVIIPSRYGTCDIFHTCGHLPGTNLLMVRDLAARLGRDTEIGFIEMWKFTNDSRRNLIRSMEAFYRRKDLNSPK